MQTTLLGIGIAIILALGTALIGPFFIDWNGYRAVLEARASQVVGTPVRVSGPISIRLLPTPSLRLDAVEIGPQASPVTAHKLAMEFGLGGLMRGEFRADEMTVDGLEATLRLDRAGRIVTPLAGLGFDPDRVGIDRLAVSNGRIVLADDASGGRLALDNFNFNGEVRSLLGPFKGEGSFTAHEGPYAFRIGGGRRGDDGGVKLRLFVDASASAVSFDADGTMWVEGNAPRFEGAMTVSRVVGAALPDGTTAIHEPWKATAKVKATSAGAAFDDLEFQYGPEARPTRLIGSAKFEFGARPRATATLTARQIDLDRTFTGADRRLPFDVVKAMAESLATGPTPPLPVRVTLGVDNLTMAGTSISTLRGDAESRADGWAIDGFEWRAPGGTQMRIGGKLAVADRKVAFTGPVRIDSTDPGVFFAWIEGRAAAGRAAVGPMRGKRRAHPRQRAHRGRGPERRVRSQVGDGAGGLSLRDRCRAGAPRCEPDGRRTRSRPRSRHRRIGVHLDHVRASQGDRACARHRADHLCGRRGDQDPRRARLRRHRPQDRAAVDRRHRRRRGGSQRPHRQFGSRPGAARSRSP